MTEKKEYSKINCESSQDFSSEKRGSNVYVY